MVSIYDAGPEGELLCIRAIKVRGGLQVKPGLTRGIRSHRVEGIFTYRREMSVSEPKSDGRGNLTWDVLVHLAVREDLRLGNENKGHLLSSWFWKSKSIILTFLSKPGLAF